MPPPPAAITTVPFSLSYAVNQSTWEISQPYVRVDGAKVAEVGTHEDLLARQGQYAELYGIQAAAYR